MSPSEKVAPASHGPRCGELLLHAAEHEEHVVERRPQLVVGIAALGQNVPARALLRHRRVRQHDRKVRRAQVAYLRLQHARMGEAGE